MTTRKDTIIFAILFFIYFDLVINYFYFGHLTNKATRLLNFAPDMNVGSRGVLLFEFFNNFIKIVP